MERRFRVGISGSYGGLNLGDEAILRGILTELRRSVDVEITVFSRDPEDTLARHEVERAVPARSLSRKESKAEIERLDLFILGGGGILFDSEALIYLREAELAIELGVPVMVYAIGVGPLQDPIARQAVQDILNRVDIITVRERSARALLEEVGVRVPIEVTADPALLLDLEPLPSDALIREGLTCRGRLIGMSVREPGPAAPHLSDLDYHGLLAQAADFMIDRYDADIVFMPMERKMLDVQHSHAVISKMAFADRASVLKGQYTSGQMLTLIDHLQFAVGMRLHFLIFAALRRVPFVALPYAGKVTGFLEALDLTAPPLQVVNAGRVIAHIDRAWDLQAEIQAHIDEKLPALQDLARENNRLALELLYNHVNHQHVTQPETIP